MSDDVLRDKGGLISPVIRRINHRGRPAILKDYRTKGFFARRIFGPYASRKEYRALRKLQGIPGIPEVYGIIDGSALAMEFIPGRTMSKYKDGSLAPEVFPEIVRIVRAMHARGVAHLDLRQKKNILITDDHRPFIIDFGGAVAPGPNAILRHLMPTLRRVDESALLKLKQRSFPALLTESDRRELAHHRFWRRFWIFTPRGKYVR